ncbi:hypothetical protein NDU88_003472 [Pleurodeles waltl]|uniref:Uncharacterized protein n=1 Tax=Pleurodeles waltl TaxID=8319 RepID=A0AAV7L1X8_PLEWA|nr:hypothetical protein NDU88_003472 [Pleurodeles waltl]
MTEDEDRPGAEPHWTEECWTLAVTNPPTTGAPSEEALDGDDTAAAEGQTYLHILPLKHVTAADREQLGAPVSTQEILKAIRALQSARTPRSDGLPSEFYNAFPGVLAERL